MVAIATWGTFSFEDTEIVSWSWTVGMTQFVEIERVSGYPATQTVGDTLDTISIGLKFRGGTARARVNSLTFFTLGQVQALQLGSTAYGNFKMVSMTVDYDLVIDNVLTSISCKLDLKKD